MSSMQESDEDRREADDEAELGRRSALHWDESDLDAWDIEDEEDLDDNPLLFDQVDFEEKRIDLPCDDKGRVFLAPLRRYDPETGDVIGHDLDVIKPPFEAKDARADQGPGEQTLADGVASAPELNQPRELNAAQIDFGLLNEERVARRRERTDQESNAEQIPAEIARESFDRLDQKDLAPSAEEDETEPALDLPLSMRVPPVIVGEATYTDETTLLPVLQGVQTIQKRWADEPAQPQAPEPEAARAAEPTAPRKPLLAPLLSSIGAVIRGTATGIGALLSGLARLILGLGRQLWTALSALLGLLFRLAKTVVSGLGVLAVAGFLKIAAGTKVASAQGMRALKSASAMSWAASLSLMRLTQRFARLSSVHLKRGLVWSGANAKRGATVSAAWSAWFGKKGLILSKHLAGDLRQGLAWSAANGKRAMIASAAWLASFGRMALGLTMVLGAAVLVAAQMIVRKAGAWAIQAFSSLRRTLPAFAAASSRVTVQAGSSTARFARAAADRPLGLIRKTAQLLQRSYETLSTSTRRIGAKSVSSMAKGKLLAMTTVRQATARSGSMLSGMTRFQATGLAAGGACLLLVMTSWGGASTSTEPFVELPFPPKPVLIPEKPLHQDPIPFEWPAFDGLPEDGTDSSALDQKPNGAFVDENQRVLRPEEALSKLIDKATTENALLSGAGLVSPTHDGTGQTNGSLSDDGQRADLRLMSLTLLADIEAIAGLAVFTEAMRIVGVDTLMTPGHPYTILVPTDDAFARFGQEKLDALLHPAGHDELRMLLSNHILTEHVRFSDFAGNVGSYLSMADHPITIAATDVIKVEEASMIETDLRAAHTVVHVIDEILMPSQLWSDASDQAGQPAGSANDI